MKKVLSKILFALIIINMFSVPNNAFAATMRYYDNVKVNDFPERLKQNLSVHPWQDGFLDITKSPYNAKGDGKTDNSDAIQKAIDDAYASNLIVYFPQGTYLISKQLVLNQYPAYWFQKEQGIKFDSQRKFGNILVGSTQNEQRPKIVLKDNSNVSNNILLLYRYYNPNAKEQDVNDRAKHYIATLRGIDIDMGSNPKVSAVSMDGAQYCTIQDVNVTGKSFYAGIRKIPGAVGSVINVKVTGGDIGILSDSYVPEALVSGVILEDQKEYGVKILDSRNSPVNLVGFKIISPDLPSENYRAIYVDERGVTEKVGGKQSRAHVTLTDGTIEVKGDNGKAIESYNQYVVMKNVYVKSNTIIDAGIKNPPIEKLQGDKNNWKKINNYAFVPKENNGSIHVDGKELGNSNSDVQYYDPILNENPAEDFIKKHIWPVKMPSYDDTNKVNIVTDYGATPYNNDDDDSVPIQKAIDDTTTIGNPNFGKEVFIPRGHFQTKNIITLKKGTKIFGAGKNISVIHESPSFKMSRNTFIVDTVDDKEANIVMSDFAILRQEASKSKGLENNKYLLMLRIRGNNTVFRDVQLAGVEEKQDNYYLNPEVIFTGNAGGKIYNLAVNTNVRAELGGNIHGDYRRVLIDGIKNPLSIYQCGVNNSEKAYMMEIRNSNNISIYAIKFEEQNQLLKIKDSSNISVTGGYGYFTIVDNVDSIITIENSKQIYLAGIGRSSMKKYDERKDKNWIINGKDSIKDDFDIILYKSSEIYPTQTSKELLQNNNFEKGLNNWKSNRSSQIKEETAHVHEGLKSIKVTNRKTADDGIMQDITSILQKEGPGSYNVSAWIMNDFQKLLNVNSNKEKDTEDKNQTKKANKNKDLESNKIKNNEINSSKIYIRIELKHDGTTEYFTLEDKAFNYWNRTSGIVNLSWKNLDSAKIYIENSSSKTDYFVDEMSFSKNANISSNSSNNYNNIKPYKPLYYIGSIGIVGLAIGLFKEFRP
ncbi:glycosyl hydrolase family 28-related protein [Clostridium lundense]|uniref:glycosyl hydrolase family 28-related protein n=1 Tax=Clostridium lundense TaxID=319475 RepID=UPI00047F06CF|nr:glycosyl hydrolase family 28-related protein [Clostridium lundense]